MVLRPLEDGDRAALRRRLADEWGLPVVSLSGAHEEPEQLPGVIAEVAGEPVGAVTYRVDGGQWEALTVHAWRPGIGAGRAMLAEVRRLAEQAGAERVWLITTDDTGAASFYERIGMTLIATHRNFVDIVRVHKPSAGGFSDAYEYEWRLRSSSLLAEDGTRRRGRAGI